MPRIPQNLFKPGDSIEPPYNAGRDEEFAELKARAAVTGRVADLEVDEFGKRQKVPANVVLFGPRGNGKSVLVHRLREWAEGEWAGRRPDLQLLLIGMDDHCDTPEQAAEFISPRPWLKKGLGGMGKLKSMRDVKAKAEDFGVRLPDLGTAGVWTVKQALAVRTAAGPCLLLCDEAHRLTKEVCADLLDASQSLRAQGAPLLLVLAGTPELEDSLRSTDASYWDRAKQIPIGPLPPGAAKDAIVKPLLPHGVTFPDAAATQAAVAAMGDYPYFTQLFGDNAAGAMNDAEHYALDGNVLADALSRFEQARNRFYVNRRNEVRVLGLQLPAAAAWGALCAGSGQGAQEMVEAAMAPHCRKKDGAASAYDELRKLGVLWDTGTGVCAGIPSLLDSMVADGGAGTRRAKAAGMKSANAWLLDERRAQEELEQAQAAMGLDDAEKS